MRSESFAFTTVLLALLGTPIFAPVAARLLSKRSTHFQRCGFMLFALYSALIITALALRVTTPMFELDVAILAVGYVIAGVVLVSAFRLRPRILGLVSGGVAVLLLSAGVFTGTVGVLGVLFVIGDFVPIYEEAIAPDHKCYVQTFGNATTSVNGYKVVLKRQMPNLPILEFPVATMEFNDTKYDLHPAEVCHRVVEAKIG